MNSITSIVLKKELKDLFRDKKTFIMGILIPLLLIPVMFYVMDKSMSSFMEDAEKSITIGIQDESNGSFGEFIKSQKNIDVKESNDFEEDVKNGDIDVAIKIPKNFEENLQKEKQSELTIIYDNSSQSSSTAFSFINSYIDVYSKEIVKVRLKQRNIDESILTPIVVKEKTSVDSSKGEGILMLSSMLPMFLIIYSVTGPLAAATDLGAGEKERGTLEPLLSTQAGRLSLLWGKFLAITVMGIITSAAFIVGVLISMNKSKNMFGGDISGINLSLGSLAIIGLICILITMVFGAIELAISIYSRSFKEAQTYLSPITIIALIPAYATFMLDPKNIDLIYFNIPVVNAIVLIKEAIAGVFDPIHIGLTFGWLLIYILISILFARYMFNREDVIFRT
ncbi:MAG TPA: ABC transporter permease [Peptostreptococcaceae bacterium]|nr:ABC transporter permease [Peptostreptococcaceae bacterium]